MAKMIVNGKCFCSYKVIWKIFGLSQFMEVIKLENMGHYRDDMIMPVDIFLLQVSVFFFLAIRLI